MNYKQANEIANWILIASILSCGGVFFTTGVVALVLLGIAVLLILTSIFIRIKYSRCPHCKKRLHLGFRMEPDKCPYCRGVLIEKDDKR